MASLSYKTVSRKQCLCFTQHPNSGQQMAKQSVLMLLLFISFTAALTDHVYYVTPDDDGTGNYLCSNCHNLSYYISQPDSYFTSDTTIVFLEGKHSYDRDDYISISNVQNLTLKGQGQWPVAGPEETSTVIINCTRGRGGIYFIDSDSITVDDLTIINCGGADTHGNQHMVIYFENVHRLFFRKNSIQHMTGYGLIIYNSGNVIITNCSFYNSANCNFTLELGGGIGIEYDGGSSTGTEYTLELSHSNMTKCCNGIYGGGIYLSIYPGFASSTARLLLSHLVLLQNKALIGGGGLATFVYENNGQLILDINYCLVAHGFAQTKKCDGPGDCYGLYNGGGGMYFEVYMQSTIRIQNANLTENFSPEAGEIYCSLDGNASLSILNSTIVNTETYSKSGVVIYNSVASHIEINNVRMKFSNLGLGLYNRRLHITVDKVTHLQIKNCIFQSCRNVSAIVSVYAPIKTEIINSTFSNNTSDRGLQSVIFIANGHSQVTISSSVISDNNMTGLTIHYSGVIFSGDNVIQNNRDSNGAGIILLQPAYMVVHGELLLSNNTADKQGGAIFVSTADIISQHTVYPCSLYFVDNSSFIEFSGNRATEGGSDMYGAKLMGCRNHELSQFVQHVPHVGQKNQTSWFFKTPLSAHIHFNNADRLSLLSSDPVMVCFCNNSNLPDCSDRTHHHMQTYPGLEISTSIATVGYYGGTSPGVVQVTAQHAALLRWYGQNKTTNCFPIHILLKNTSSTTALVDVAVDGGQPGWGVSIEVDIVDCPLGFAIENTSGECHCEPYLDANYVQCNVSLTPFKFARSGNGWFGHINNTQCVTGTTNCPFDYCNQSKLLFDIMAPDRQCVANRAGILCGQCQSHLSIMLGSNHCGTCSNWYLFLLPVFGLAGIVLIAVLMFLNMSVSVGTINGLLFYANMVKLNEAFFLPNGSVPVVSQFISWLNLDLGIEVCFFDGLDGYWNTWLQFVFPAYLFLLMGCIIVGCRYSVWLCRLCGSHAVPGLATLFLMSYTKILLTVTNALSMYRLQCNDSILTVWSIDGNIEYYNGKHISLVLFSCGIFVIGLTYPMLMLCAPMIEKYSHKCISHQLYIMTKFKPLLDAYGGPYKDNYRFWTSVNLLVRLVVTVVFSFTSGRLVVINSYIITSAIVGIFTFWSFTKGVYKSIYLTALEIFYLLNLFVLSTATLATKSTGAEHSQILTIVSVCMSLSVYLVTIAVHLWWKFDLKNIKRRLGLSYNQPEYVALPQVAADEDNEGDRSPDTPPHQFLPQFPLHNAELISPVILEREPLLFDTYSLKD